MKNYKIIAIVLVMGLIFSGCNMVEVNTERDAQTVIANVGDEVVVKGDFQELYDMYVMYGQISPDMADDPMYASYYESSVNSIIDQLVDEKVQISKAKELGLYNLSAEEAQEIQDQVDSLLETYTNAFKNELSLDAENEGKSDEELLQIASERIDEYLAQYSMSQDEVKKIYEDQLVLEKLYNLTTESITVTEDEVKAEYDSLVAEQQAGYAEGTIGYESIANGGETIYYTPEGVRQAQHILISISDEESANIQELTQAGDSDGAQAALDEALTAIKADADAAYERAIAGEDFVVLMEELGTDPGMQSTDYYLVLEETAQFVPEFAQGLFQLSAVGDISEPVATAFGYHILKYYGDEPSGAVNYDDVRDNLYDGLLSDRQNTHFGEELNKWKEALDINVKYDKALD